MAFPTVTRTGGTQANPSTDTQPITLPAHVAGDLLLAIIALADESQTASWSNGFVELFDFSGLAGAYKRATSGAETLTVTSSGTCRSAHVSFAIAGAENPSTQAPQIGANTEGGPDTAPDPPSVTPTGGAKDYLWVVVASLENSATSFTLAPTNYGNLQSFGTTGGANGSLIGSAERALNAASEDPGAFTVANSVVWNTQTIAIHPVTVVPPTPPAAPRRVLRSPRYAITQQASR